MTRQENNKWIQEGERTLIKTPVMDLVETDCRSSEDHRPHRFYVLRTLDWSNVIPVTQEGKIVLVKQYRVGISDHTLEIPGGVISPSDTDPKATAIREMTEETGYVPLPGARCVELGWTFPNPAIMGNRCHSFIVGPVHKAEHQNLDPGEMIEVIEVPIEEIPSLIVSGKINHALILNAFFQLTLRSTDSSRSLLNQLKSFATIQSPIQK